MKILLRNDIKKLIKDNKFWETFPEYRELHEKIITKKVKIGCCNLSDLIYQEVLGYIQKNPVKWKEYFKTDKIQIYPNGKGVLL